MLKQVVGQVWNNACGDKIRPCFYVPSAMRRVTCKQVAVAGTNSKDIKPALNSLPACIAIAQILADRATEADVVTASYTPRDTDKFEGKIRAVVQSLIDSGIHVKIYLH